MREVEREKPNIIYYFCLHPSEQLVLCLRTNRSQMVKINPFPHPEMSFGLLIAKIATVFIPPMLVRLGTFPTRP